jgi:voltage-gated potassium channel Kch
MFVLAVFGFKKRTAFMTSICLAQISEFSLIIVRLGYDKGHIGADVFSLTILSAIITIALTSYLVKYDDKLYAFIGRKLSWFEKLSSKNHHSISYFPEDGKYDSVLVGYDRIGYSIFQKLKKMKRRTIIVDMNPDIIRELISEKVNCIYGDIGDSDILSMLSLEKKELVISTIPNHQETVLLIKRAREKNPEATIIVTAYDAEEALHLYELGADYVIIPHFLGGERISYILDDIAGSLKKRMKMKVKHMSALQERIKRHGKHG